MPITQKTALAMVTRLGSAIDGRRRTLNRLDAYYRGDHPLPKAPKTARDAYLQLMQMSRSNWMQLVVDAAAERLQVDGFRFTAAGDADLEAWSKYWQPNQMDALSELVHVDALATRYAYVLVWPSADPEIPVSITPESATEVIVDYEPGSRFRRRAALKLFTDRDTGFTYACLWTPDEVWKFRRPMRQLAWSETVQWYPDPADGEEFPATNPLGVVPVVEFECRPRLKGPGQSEIEGVTDIQDRINNTILNRLMAEQFAAFKQKWVTGYEVPEDENGNPKEPWDAAVDRVWVAEDPEVRFGEFSESDLSGYIKGVEADIQHLAAITRTPPHYLLGQSGAFPSGESLKSTETGLVARVRRHQRNFGERWEDVMRLALRAAGDPRATDTSCEVIWADPESRTEGELVDALLKMKSLGVPNEALWQRWGASQAEIARWRAMGARESLLGDIGRPPALPPTPTPAEPPAPEPPPA